MVNVATEFHTQTWHGMAWHGMAGHVARMGRKKILIGFSWISEKERDTAKQATWQPHKKNNTAHQKTYEKHMGTTCIHSNQEIKLALQRQQLP
jgi:hypothetical protein